MALMALREMPSERDWQCQQSHRFEAHTSTCSPHDAWNFPLQIIAEPKAYRYMAAPAYNTLATTTFASPQCLNQRIFSTAPYQGSSPPAPFEHLYKLEPSRMVEPYVEPARWRACGRRSQQPSEDPNQSPSRQIICSIGSGLNTNSKTITYNETINPADRVNFETEVDELLKVIQQIEAGRAETLVSPHAQPWDIGAGLGAQGPCSSRQPSNAGQMEPVRKKKWICDGPKCNKRFVQKAHLDVHRRAHTGDKPYMCTEPSCGLTFSQKGNLKTHIRRHTGEKPYACSICGKPFASSSSLRSHEKTHDGLKPFVCRLNDCNKTFSQLGNMKVHQNKIHKETLRGLTDLLIRFAAKTDVPEEYQGLFEYFKFHYKNSNKGIKGRGKYRRLQQRAIPEHSE